MLRDGWELRLSQYGGFLPSVSYAPIWNDPGFRLAGSRDFGTSSAEQRKKSMQFRFSSVNCILQK